MSDLAREHLHFETFGYLFARGIFNAEEVAWLQGTYDEFTAQQRGGAPIDAGHGHEEVEVFERHAALTRAFLLDARIYDRVHAFCGDGFVWCGSEAQTTVKTAHPWHADRVGANAADVGCLKILCYLDETRAERGCLRVLPGSHRAPYHEDLLPILNGKPESVHASFGCAPEDLPSVAVEAQPGDCLFFNQALWHAVFHSFPGRRYLALKFARRPETDTALACLHHYSAGAAFRPHEGFVTHEDERIRQMVDGLSDLAGRAAEAAAQTALA